MHSNDQLCRKLETLVVHDTQYNHQIKLLEINLHRSLYEILFLKSSDVLGFGFSSQLKAQLATMEDRINEIHVG